jgi:MFS family permease
MLWLGWLLCVSGLVCASFATQIWHLHVFQGIMYGAGWVIYFSPFLLIINEWWVERRGLAYGLWFTSGNASGLVMPFIFQKLLDRYGFRITLRLYAFASVLIAGPALLLVRSRLQKKSAMSSSAKKKLLPNLLPPRYLFKNEHFYIYGAAIFLESLVYVVASVFLPSFADSLHLPKGSGSFLLALASISTICGQLAIGFVSGNYHPYTLLSLSTFICSAAALVAQSATSFLGLAAFAVLWGFFASPYSVLFPKICKILTTNAGDSLILYGFLCLERGAAVLLEGFISIALVDDREEGFARYQNLLRLSAWCMFASSLCGLGYFRRS